MRVLAVGSVYPPHLLGGYEVIWQGVTERLRAEGHAAAVLVSDYRHPDVDAAMPDDPDVRRELRWYWRDHGWPRLSLRERLDLEQHNAAVFDRRLAEFAPDVVAFWPMGGMSLSLITRAQRAGLATVFFVLDPWPVYGPVRDGWLSLWARPGLRRLRSPIARLSALPTELDLSRGRWIFCSEAMRADARLSLTRSQQRVLSPGVEQRFLATESTPAGAWRWRLLYLGRVVEQKGVITAVDALAQLPPAARLTIVGSGDRAYRAALERRAAELGVADRVQFQTQVSREATIACYDSADVVLHPVLWREPWGLAPLEAMARRRPVIATGQGGSADFLADGVNALLHAPGDSGGLAAAVTRLAADATLRRRLVSAGRATAERHSATAFETAAVAELLGAVGG